MSRQSIKRHLPRFADFEADEREVEFAKEVAVPAVAAVATAAIAFGVAKACCGVDVRKYDPKGLLPLGMIALTGGVALWTYLNPLPTRD